MTYETPTIRALRLEEVLDKVSVSRTTLYNLIKEGDFPGQIKYGRASRWLDQEVNEWLRKKAEARNMGTRAAT